ncbi:hypothetical protein MMC08_004144 [Hypocenomyce scalaris]|nr:hypothetical protein [Hypocenomyce scalaris]
MGDIEPDIPDLDPEASDDEIYRHFVALTSRKGPRVQVISLFYGDRQITDRLVLERFYNAIRDYQSIQIIDDHLGVDPKPGVRKEFVIEYKNLGNDDNRYIKRRKMLEYETLDFAWDMVSVMWGVHPNIWTLDRFPKAFENLFWALDHGGEMLITNDTLGCDPAPGQRKTLRVDYSRQGHMVNRENVGENSPIRFRGRWGEPKKEPSCVVM